MASAFFKPVRYQRLLLFVIVSSSAFCSASTTTTYTITVDEGTDAFVTSPEKCGTDLSNGGGDLVEAGVRYRGKCQGAGIAPIIEAKDGARYLKFSTDPSYQGETKTRTELALTSQWFSFGEPVYLGFRIRIPKEVDKTAASFYMMQFWQCSPAPPIAGIRMSRGHSHRINFMTRGDSRAASMATYDVNPDTWTSFVIKAIVDPSGKNGSLEVWNSIREKAEVFSGSYGYAQDRTCKDQIETPQRFRIKFGIYKGNEKSGLYEVHYDDIRIGNSFDAVSPWLRLM